jgi:hypothetical protein
MFESSIRQTNTAESIQHVGVLQRWIQALPVLARYGCRARQEDAAAPSNMLPIDVVHMQKRSTG